MLNHEDDSISRIYRVLIFTDFEEIGVHRVPALLSLLLSVINSTPNVMSEFSGEQIAGNSRETKE